MARFYGLPKVHKQGVPLRPIVSLRGIPTFGLSKWLYQRLCFLTKDSEWTVKSAEEFLTRIKHLEVEADEVMVSFDVISLFTSIPPALDIDTIDGFLREKYDETDQQLKRAHIIELPELCLKTFFKFNGQVYEQKKGTPMGSPLAGLIAEAVLQRLEQQVFSSYPPKFWARYVDDTFVVIKRNEVKAFKTLLNSIFPDIQFTMEEEVNNQLPFLDVQVTRLTDGKIRTTVYRKATNTRRILLVRSSHPVGHKRSCVITLFQRVQTHCSDDSGRKAEMNYLQGLFKANGYPKSFICNCLKKPHFERSSGEKPKFWLSIAYVKNVSEATARILKLFGIGVAHKPECTIRQQIMKPKDPLPTTEQSAVVYSIPCLNCNARVLSQAVTKCVELIGDDGVAHLQQVINKRARNLRATRDAELAVKLQSISKSSQEENEVLVHNMSSKQLTPAQMKVLSHEACFNTTDADPVNLVATVESILKQTGESDETKHLIRQQVASLAMSHKPRATITKAEQSALKTLRADASIVILPADKGRSTVVMDKADYIQKANALLEDRQAYLPCNGEPMRRLVTQLDKTLTDMQTSKAISKSVRLAIKPVDAAAPSFYGLPKVHKAGVPLRPIVSLRGAPTFNLAKWLFRNLRSLNSDAGTTVCSATRFLERIRGMRLTEDEVMVSFDVTSLFTSIPQDLAIETVSELLESQYDETDVTVKRRHLVQLLTFCLKTYFTFEGTTYEQVKGTPMGSPLSGFIAEAVLQKV
nr:unnamed protein product [Spirometra erinaceieuropaei]